MTATPKRRWYQFSLKTMLVVITVVCVALGYVVYKRGQAEGARLAAESLRKKGGNYAFTKGKLPGERDDFSLAILGDDSHEHMAALWLVGPQFHDADLKEVAKLKFLNTLILSDSDFSDAGLAPIRALSHMEYLYLSDCSRLTDECLLHLQLMTRLKELSLHGTSVSDQGLVHLWKLKQLEYVNLKGTHASEAGIQNLQRQLPKLRIDRNR